MELAETRRRRPIGHTRPARRGGARLPADHRRWVVRYGLVGTAGTNVVINATFAWVASIGRTRVPAWTVPLVGGPSIIGSTLELLAVSPLATSVICTTCIRLYQRRGLRLLGSSELLPPVHHLIVGPVRRDIRLAAASAAAFAPLIVLVGLVGVGRGLSRAGFIASQSLTGMLLGALITPLVALAAMAEPTSRTR